MSNDDVAREINELLGIGEHEPDFGPDPIKVLLDKHYPPISVGTGLAKRLRDAAYGTADPRSIMLEAAEALEVPIPADLAASIGVITADGRNHVVTVLGSEEAVKVLIAMTESRPAEGTWAWALERMKEGKRVTIDDPRLSYVSLSLALAIYDGEFYECHHYYNKWVRGSRPFLFNSADFERTDWRVVEADQ